MLPLNATWDAAKEAIREDNTIANAPFSIQGAKPVKELLDSPTATTIPGKLCVFMAQWKSSDAAVKSGRTHSRLPPSVSQAFSDLLFGLGAGKRDKNVSPEVAKMEGVALYGATHGSKVFGPDFAYLTTMRYLSKGERNVVFTPVSAFLEHCVKEKLIAADADDSYPALFNLAEQHMDQTMLDNMAKNGVPLYSGVATAGSLCYVPGHWFVWESIRSEQKVDNVGLRCAYFSGTEGNPFKNLATLAQLALQKQGGEPDALKSALVAVDKMCS